MARWKKILEDSNNTIPAPNPVLKADKVEITRTVSFITPMFGGGVKTENHPYDDITPVRVSSIRGQLRFWWRAAVGSGMQPIKDAAGNLLKSAVEIMHAEEARLFGNTQHRASVEIYIKKQPVVVEPAAPYKIPENKNKWLATSIGYACFALRQGGNLHQINGEFEIQIHCLKKDKADIELALECWLAFGGLGGRTRRGFGALKGGLWSLENIFQKIPKRRTHLKDVPSLRGAKHQLSDKTWNQTNLAHEFGLKKLKNFRQTTDGEVQQGEISGRNGTQNVPGRSKWPEPDAIRRLENPNADVWGLHRPVHSAGNVFPRAVFGMPISFTFRSSHNNQKLPKPRTLLPYRRDQNNYSSCERMASPLIIRPYIDPTKNNFKALALVLDVSFPNTEVKTKDQIKDKRRPPGTNVLFTLTQQQASSIWPLHAYTRDAFTDPLSAFLDYFGRP